MSHEIKIVAAVIALIRGDITASYIAETFGVTEVQVQGWKDIFQVAGVVALANALKSETEHCEEDTDEDGEPTTTARPRSTTPRPRTTRPVPTTTRHPIGRPSKRPPCS